MIHHQQNHRNHDNEPPISVDGTDVLNLLRSRRVTREFQPGPLDQADLWMILEAGRWSTSASNSRVHRLLVVQNHRRMRLLAAMSPGIYSMPGAMIVVCLDLSAADRAGFRTPHAHELFIDAGTLMMNMMVEAHALGLGTCPVTSFSQAGVGVVLGLPAHARADVIMLVGHTGPTRSGGARPGRGRSRLLADLVFWEEYGAGPPST